MQKIKVIKKNIYNKVLNEIDSSMQDIKKRVIKNGFESIAFLYISQLTDKKMLSNDIIKPIHISIHEKGSAIGIQEICESIICCCELYTDDKQEKIMEYILKGMTVVIFSNDIKYIVLNTTKIEKRSIETPELTFTLRGPRDCFNENLDDNLSLVRYRIKDPKLNFNNLEVGRRTKTRISIIYISDVVNDSIVEDVTKRIEKIDVDGIISSGELQQLILNKKTDLFPQVGVAERSDMVAGALLEGKVAILVDGSGIALIVPKIFSEFFASGDDIYDNTLLAIFLKQVRMYSSFLSVTITALYVAILSFHIDTLPVDFVNVISASSQGVPFTVFAGALILEIIIEILREALLRVPKQIGSAIGMVGGVVIGQAAIAAKIFSPLLLIIVSISLLSSFTVPDYTIMNPLRIIKYFLIIISAIFGLIGFTLAVSIVLINLVSINSFGVPYFSPFAPFNWYDFKSTFLYSRDISRLRPNFLKTKDNTRSNSEKK